MSSQIPFILQSKNISSLYSFFWLTLSEQYMYKLRYTLISRAGKTVSELNAFFNPEKIDGIFAFLQYYVFLWSIFALIPASVQVCNISWQIIDGRPNRLNTSIWSHIYTLYRGVYYAFRSFTPLPSPWDNFSSVPSCGGQDEAFITQTDAILRHFTPLLMHFFPFSLPSF